MAKRSLVYAANWKMHHGPVAARDFLTRFLQVTTPSPERRLWFFPPAVAIAAAAEAAADVAVKSSISSMFEWLMFSPAPAIHTGFVFTLRAISGFVISTAPPWSVTRQQCSSVSGHEIMRDFCTSSTVIGPPSGCVSFECITARGLRVAHWRVTTAMWAKSSGVVP